jgi:hypothetical protein
MQKQVESGKVEGITHLVAVNGTTEYLEVAGCSEIAEENRPPGRHHSADLFISTKARCYDEQPYDGEYHLPATASAHKVLRIGASKRRALHHNWQLIESSRRTESITDPSQAAMKRR